MQCSIKICQFAKRAQITFGALCGNHKLNAPQATHIMFCNTDGKTIFKKIKKGGLLQNLCTIRDPKTEQGLPNHTAFRLTLSRVYAFIHGNIL